MRVRIFADCIVGALTPLDLVGGQLVLGNAGDDLGVVTERLRAPAEIGDELLPSRGKRAL
jgi:hypothetical protein